MVLWVLRDGHAQVLMLCERPAAKVKAPASDAQPFLPSSGRRAMEGIGLNPVRAPVRIRTP